MFFRAKSSVNSIEGIESIDDASRSDACPSDATVTASLPTLLEAPAATAKQATRHLTAPGSAASGPAASDPASSVKTTPNQTKSMKLRRSCGVDRLSRCCWHEVLGGHGGHKRCCGWLQAQGC
ncbi:hypothetical protein CLOP_g14043 [Closterium sp. NIES-67]|nr:hypothetical protein CLOP_g17734 [Closterium sp. NIES-67]GJP83944.1 hypothetical protein CLOP_g14043 [Closterium sp. NIES-67]